MNKYRVPQSTRPSKMRLMERTVGQPFPIIIPDGYRKMQEEFNRPRPVVALRIRVGRDGLIKTLHLMEEDRSREAQGAITLEHPVVVKLLKDYYLIERYEYQKQGITVYDYARCPAEPTLVRAGSGHFVVAEPTAPALPAELHDLAVVPASTLADWDLQIASKKNGRGSTSSADAPIAWWQVKGQPKETPARTVSLISSVVMKKLLAYELVDTVAGEFEIIRKYRKLPAVAHNGQ